MNECIRTTLRDILRLSLMQWKPTEKHWKCISHAVTYNAISNAPDNVGYLEEKETSLEIN